MLSSEEFGSRLTTVRAAYAAMDPTEKGNGYLNGDVPLDSSDVSAWDNFDRYFKFYSIYPA